MNIEGISLLTDLEAAEYLSVSPSSLRKWRSGARPKGPAFLRMGRAVRYRQRDLDAFVDDHIVSSMVPEDFSRVARKGAGRGVTTSKNERNASHESLHSIG